MRKKSDKKSFVDESFLSKVAASETIANALHNNLQQLYNAAAYQQQLV